MSFIPHAHQAVQPEPSPEGGATPSSGAPRRLRRLRDLPGPRPWPLVGNALQVRLDKVHQHVEAWVRQYGPLLHVQLGGFPLMVISDHELIAQLLRERPERFRRPSRMQEVLSEMGVVDGVFVAEGERWHKQRRMVMASFAPGQVRAYLPTILKVAERLRRRWSNAAMTAQGSRRGLDLQAELMRFTVDVISGLAFGTDVNTIDSDEDVIQRHLDKIFPTVWRRTNAIVPYWRYVQLPRDRAVARSMKAVTLAVRGFISQARVRLQDPDRRAAPANMLEAMLVAADEPDSGLNDDDVLGNVFTMLLAGEDTTATSLSWMFYLMSRHPAVMTRAREEVDRTLGDMADWTADDLGQLDYLEACIHESMRLKPVGPFNVVEATQDTVVADVALKAGTPIVMVMRHDTLDETLFPQAQRFLPERWLSDAASDAAALAPHHAKRVSMPFGAGPRICPGRYLALLEIKVVAAMVLRHFDVVALTTPDGREAEEHMALTMVPVGLRMKLRSRAA